jgi:uncharacterized protein with HEPN domain
VQRKPSPLLKIGGAAILTQIELVLSIVKSIEILGEAASKVTQQTREMYSEIPWANIIGMRNRLIHVYFGIDLDRVWDTVTDDLPPLIASLEKIILQNDKSS